MLGITVWCPGGRLISDMVPPARTRSSSAELDTPPSISHSASCGVMARASARLAQAHFATLLKAFGFEVIDEVAARHWASRVVPTIPGDVDESRSAGTFQPSHQLAARVEDAERPAGFRRHSGADRLRLYRMERGAGNRRRRW